MLPPEELVDLDSGDLCLLFKDLESAPVTRKKKSKLLNELIGITDLNLGLDCMMIDALQPYKRLIERLQVQTGPR